MLKLGLMGCGTVANYGHLPAIRKKPEIQLVSVFDPHPQRLEEARRKFDVPGAFTDVEAFFHSGIDAVSIASAAPAHLGNVLQAAGHGKHALCEKPLAMNEGEIGQMIAATKRAGVMLFTGFNHRFSSTAMKIKQLIEGDSIGTRGVIHCDREARYCEVRNDKGTAQFEWQLKKEFPGMYAEFAKAMHSGHFGDLASAGDGLIATRIAREATEQAMRDRLSQKKGQI